MEEFRTDIATMVARQDPEEMATPAVVGACELLERIFRPAVLEQLVHALIGR
jgi:hypothetical protein